VIPHDINPQRFQSLLRYGIDGESLFQFFKESKAALLSVGAKVGNLPPSPEAARKVITGFNAKAHRVFGKWIAAKAARGKTISHPADELVDRLRAIELGEQEMAEEEQKALHVSGLQQYYSEQPAPRWIEFLRTPIGGHANEADAPGPADWAALLRWWLGAAPKPRDGLVGAVASLRAAIDESDPQLLEDLPAFKGATTELRSQITQAYQLQQLSTAVLGVVAEGPPLQDFDPDLDYSQMAVIATNRSSKVTEPFFVSAEAFITDSGEVFSLSPTDMRRALPKDGRIVLHKDRGFPSAPAIGESLVYEVQDYETDLPVKVKAIGSIPERLFRVIHIPVTSKEAHKIRDAIVVYARSPGARLAVFVTLDKVCLRPRGDNIQNVLSPAFDWHLERWDSLKAVELANGAYVVGPLPSAALGLDCSPLSSAARRLLKLFSQRGDSKTSKGQRDLLQELLSSDDLNFEDSTKERLRNNIDSIGRGTDDFDALISDLLRSKPVQADIERRVIEKVDALAAERAKELQSIESLQREKANLAKGIERLREDAEKKTKAVRGAIQKAFANTRAKELESLGELAVFEALLSRRSESASAATAASHQAGTAPEIAWSNPLTPSNMPLDRLFREFGLNSQIAERVEQIVGLGTRLGLPIAITGVGANHLGTQLAAALCTKSCVVGDVVIGLLGSSGVVAKMAETTADAILLRNANLSDLSVYASDLLSLICQSALEKVPTSQRMTVLLTAVTGPASLAMPDEVRQFALNLNLLTIEDALANPPTTGIVENVLWRRLTAKVEKLEEREPEVGRTFVDLRALMSVAAQ
jgi:hypothetical protein